MKEDFHSHPSTMGKATESTNNNKNLKVEDNNVNNNNYQIIFRLKATSFIWRQHFRLKATFVNSKAVFFEPAQ